MNPSHPSGPKSSPEEQQQSANLPPSPQPENTLGKIPDSGEKYTLEEMMRTLRENERQKDEQGEMVTRSDGSTARKVRRRKRRSEQPKENKKNKEELQKKTIFVRSALAVGAFLFLLMAGLFLLVAFNSDSYEEKLESRAGEWTGAQVDVSQHKVLPGSLSAEAIQLDWPENSHLVDFSMKKIEGDIRFVSMLGAKMGGQSMGGKLGTLRVRSASNLGVFSGITDPSEYPFSYNRYYCDSLDVFFGTGGQLALKDIETSMRHFGEEGFRVTISDGTLSLKGWQNFSINSGLLKFPEGKIKIDSMRLRNPLEDRIGSADSIVVSGLIPLKPGEKAQLDLTTSSFPFEVILGEQMGSFFSGPMRVERGVINYVTGSDQLDEVMVNFNGDAITLNRFPLVENIKKYIFKNADQKMLFDSEAKGLYRWTPRGITLENLIMANKKLRIEGNMVIAANEKIRGQLTMWISMGYINGNAELESHPAFRNRSQDGGYAIINIELGGTTTLPSDNFLSATGLSSTFRKSEGPPKKSAAELLRELDSLAE